MNLQNLKKIITRVIFELTHPFQLRDVENNEITRHSSLHQAQHLAFDLAFEHLIERRDEHDGTVSVLDAAAEYQITAFGLLVWSCRAEDLWHPKTRPGAAR